MKHRDDHWRDVETRRTAKGLPIGVFDFLSVHDGVLPNPHPYSLLAPMCIVEAEPQQRRPIWEDCRFRRKADAMAFARQLVAYYQPRFPRVFALDCTARREKPACPDHVLRDAWCPRCPQD